MDYTKLASDEVIASVSEGINKRGFEAVVVGSKAEALEKIKELIPKGVSVMNGASVTLQEIGFIDYLKAGEHGWRNLHAEILAETDKEKQAQLRKQSVISDFYLGSVHALAQTG